MENNKTILKEKGRQERDEGNSVLKFNWIKQLGLNGEMHSVLHTALVATYRENKWREGGEVRVSRE